MGSIATSRRSSAAVPAPGTTSGCSRRSTALPTTRPTGWGRSGGTVGLPFNGAGSHVSLSPHAASTLRRELRGGGFDVVHVHEPVAMLAGRHAVSVAHAPLVETSTRTPRTSARTPSPRWPARDGSSTGSTCGSRSPEAAAWTGRRFWGGEYRVIPNGVALPRRRRAAPRPRRPGEPLEIVFVGQAVERKGLSVLLRAFEALREHVPARLTVVGVEAEDLAPLLADPTGVRALGRVDDAAKRLALEAAHVLCAPSLRGESFGMVLTEAFAAGTPVVASDIAGYRDVVTPGSDGLLVPAGDPVALAETLRDLAVDTSRLDRLGRHTAAAAETYAWPHVAERVDRGLRGRDRGAGSRARRGARGGPPRAAPRRRRPAPPGAPPRAAGPAAQRRVTHGACGPAGRARARGARRRGRQLVRRATDRLELRRVEGPRLEPVWVLLAVGLMCASMVLRAVSWHAILRAALPSARPRLVDALQGTTIGVLMSATLPARLGEVSRAMIVARRLGRPRDALPAVLGSVVAQTLLNLLALTVLGVVMLQTIGLFAGRQGALLVYAIAPLAILCVVLAAPALLHAGRVSRSERLQHWLRTARAALMRVRSGLAVFRRPRLGLVATTAQLAAWALQWLACVALMRATGLYDHGAGLGAAAAVLFAVNVSAVLPLTPSNLGVFQAACVAVLVSGYHVGAADALGYAIILQAVEVATAVVMGAPALVKEGVSWREVRLRAMHSAPVSLGARHAASES